MSRQAGRVLNRGAQVSMITWPGDRLRPLIKFEIWEWTWGGLFQFELHCIAFERSKVEGDGQETRKREDSTGESSDIHGQACYTAMIRRYSVADGRLIM